MPKSLRSGPEAVQRRPSGLKAVLDPHPVMVLKRRSGVGVVRFVEDPLAAGALDQVVVRAAVDLHQTEPGPLPVKAVTGNGVEAAPAPVVVVGPDVPHAVLAVHVEHVGAYHLGGVQRPRRPGGEHRTCRMALVQVEAEPVFHLRLVGAAGNQVGVEVPDEWHAALVEGKQHHLVQGIGRAGIHDPHLRHLLSVNCPDRFVRYPPDQSSPRGRSPANRAPASQPAAPLPVSRGRKTNNNPGAEQCNPAGTVSMSPLQLTPPGDFTIRQTDAPHPSFHRAHR